MILPVEGIRLHLPFPTPSQNVYQRWHYRRRGRFRDEVRLHLRSQLRRLHPGPLTPEERRVVVEILRRSTGTLDYGNLVGGGKACLDAIVLEGLLHDDSPRWVKEVYHQERWCRGAESTHIWVYPAVEQVPGG
jgi:hypothetical protein